MLKKLITFLCLIASLAVVVFAYFNQEKVQVDYLFGTLEIHLSWLVIGSFIVGLLVMLPFFAVTGYYWKLKANKLKKQLMALEKQRKKEDIAKDYLSSH